MTTCPCGQPLRPSNLKRDQGRKFCSRSCAGTYGGGRAPKSTHCGRCGWARTPENTYSSGACRRCTLAEGRADYVPGPRGKPRRPVRVEKPAPVQPAPPVEPVVPVWRPSAPGWPARPGAGRAGC